MCGILISYYFFAFINIYSVKYKNVAKAVLESHFVELMLFLNVVQDVVFKFFSFISSMHFFLLKIIPFRLLLFWHCINYYSLLFASMQLYIFN